MIKKLLIAIALLTSVFASAQSTHVPATLNEYIHHVLDSIYNNAGPRSISRQNVANLYLDLARFDSANYAPYTILGQPNGIATLGGDGKVPASELATIALGNTFVVADQAAMLSLNASIGDIAVRADSGITFVLQTAPASVYSNWVQIVVNYIPVSSILGAQAINDTTTYDATKTDIANGQAQDVKYGDSTWLYYTQRRQDSISAMYLKQGGDARAVIVGSSNANPDTIVVNDTARVVIALDGSVTLISKNARLSIEQTGMSAGTQFGAGGRPAANFNPAVPTNNPYIYLGNTLMYSNGSGTLNLSARWIDYAGSNRLWALVTDTVTKLVYKIPLDSVINATVLADSNVLLNYTKSLITNVLLDTSYINAQISNGVQPVYQAIADSADSIRASIHNYTLDTTYLQTQINDSVKGKISYNDTVKELVTRNYLSFRIMKRYNIMDFGAKRDTSDATQALQACIDTANAHDYDGIIYIPSPGRFLIKGPLLKSTPEGYPINAQVYIPVRHFLPTPTGNVVGLPIFEGDNYPSQNEAAPTGAFNTTQFSEGSILQSTIENDGSAFPSVISTSGDSSYNFFYNPPYDTDRYDRISNMEPVFRNLHIRVHFDAANGGTQLCGIDMNNAANNVFENCRVDQDTALGYVTFPTNNVFGLRGSRTNHASTSIFRNDYIIGFTYGYVCGEHTSMFDCQAYKDYYAVELTESNHGSYICNLEVAWCAVKISTGHMLPIGQVGVEIADLDAENSTIPGWMSAVWDVEDSLNLLYGKCSFRIGNPQPGFAWTGNPGKGGLAGIINNYGASNLRCPNLAFPGNAGRTKNGNPKFLADSLGSSAIVKDGTPNNEYGIYVGDAVSGLNMMVFADGQAAGGGFGFMNRLRTSFNAIVDDAGNLILPNMATATIGTLLPTVVNTTANAYGANIVDKMSIANYRTLIGINNDSGVSVAGSLGSYAPLPTVTSTATSHLFTFSQSTSAAYTVLANNTSSTAASTYVSIPTMLTEAVQTATDANYTVTAPTTYSTVVILPTATASHTLTLPSAVTYSGRYVKIWNKNTSGTFLWTYVTTVKDGTSTTITAIANGAWAIIWSDGANWNKQN